MYIVQVQIHVGLHVGYIFDPLIREKSQYEIEDNGLFSRLSNNERTCRSQENKKKFNKKDKFTRPHVLCGIT